MLIGCRDLKRYWGLHPESILHVGAHHAEERGDYEACGWGRERVIWIEALASAAAIATENVRELPHHVVVQALVWSTSGQRITFRESSNGQSSSVFEFGTHSVSYPSIAVTREFTETTRCLEEILRDLSVEAVEFINLDIQGAELEALRGLGEVLHTARAVYCEVNTDEVYVGCASYEELDTWLTPRGFTRVDHQLTRQGWGDALWIRTSCLPRGLRIRRLARRLSTLLNQLFDAEGGFTLPAKARLRRAVRAYRSGTRKV